MKTISKKYFAIIFILLTFLASHSIARHQHSSDSTQTEKKKMSCCKNMDYSKHEMKTETNEMKDEKIIDIEKIDMNKDGKVFIDGMCIDVVKDEPGNCPKCGMELKEVSLEDAHKALDKKTHEMMGDNKMDEHKMDHSKMMNHEMKHADSDKIDMKKDIIVREGEIDLITIDKNGDKKVFQDQMDWNVISDEAGECPLCGMKLKEVTLEKAKENLIRHSYKVKD